MPPVRFVALILTVLAAAGATVWAGAALVQGGSPTGVLAVALVLAALAARQLWRRAVRRPPTGKGSGS